MAAPQPQAEPKLLIPALAPLYKALEPYTWPLIRVTAGLMLVPHGYDKWANRSFDQMAAGFAKMGLEPAYALVVYIALLEFVGGLMLACGLFTRLVAVLVAGFMAVAVVQVHLANGFFWNNARGGFEYPLFWGLVCIALAIRGGGPLSVDAKIGREV
ncbi:MAG: DoxX family protein [Rhodospirillales bacterium]|nr:DoxX family protein [Rhodospirillales bacterium]